MDSLTAISGVKLSIAAMMQQCGRCCAMSAKPVAQEPTRLSSILPDMLEVRALVFLCAAPTMINEVVLVKSTWCTECMASIPERWREQEDCTRCIGSDARIHTLLRGACARELKLGKDCVPPEPSCDDETLLSQSSADLLPSDTLHARKASLVAVLATFFVLHCTPAACVFFQLRVSRGLRQLQTPAVAAVVAI
eukprot:4940204-Amphidinium_carterae.1